MEGGEEDENRSSFFLENRKKFQPTDLHDKRCKEIIQRHRQERNHSQHLQDIETIVLFNEQEKIHFISLWYDMMREVDHENHLGYEETAEQFLSSFGITKDKCIDEEWHQWVIALSKGAADDRSTRRRSSTSTAPVSSTKSTIPGEHENNGEVIIPIRRESVADIRRKFNSRSKLDTTETESQRIIKRNFLPSLRMTNSSHVQDCEYVQTLNSADKIDFISNWYDLLREKGDDPEFEHKENPEEFLSSFGIKKELCSESDWREWVIALSKSAAYDRSSKKRRNSSIKKINSPERTSITNSDDGSAERGSELMNPVPDIPVPEVPLSTHEEMPSTSASQNIQNSPSRTSTSHVDDFHSQVISSSHSVNEYKKALTAASVVFAQAPDEDRESMWSNVELSFSDVAQTSAQNPYIRPESVEVASPIHSTTTHHISIDEESKSQPSTKQSNCCMIL